MDSRTSASLARRLIELKTEHRDLDTMIERLSGDPGMDQLSLARMKRRKLRLKDEIVWIECKLLPDLDA